MKLFLKRLLLVGAVMTGSLLLMGAAQTHSDHQEAAARLLAALGEEEKDIAFLGVNVEDSDHGPRVEGVVEDSPAEAAGIQEGDVIVRLGGKEVGGPSSLTSQIRSFEPGDEVKIEVLRDGKRTTFTAKLGKRPSSLFLFGPDRAPTLQWDQEKLRERMQELRDRMKNLQWGTPRGGVFRVFSQRPKLGVQLVEGVTPELREHLGGGGNAGVLVGKVLPDMPAEKAGIRVGDLIVSVNGQEVEEAGDLVEALEDQEGKAVTLEIVRDGKTTNLEVLIPEPQEEDDATGPRAWHVEPIPLDLGVSEAIQESVRAALEAAQARGADARTMVTNARRAAREAAREAARARRTAMDAAAIQMQVQREVQRAIREATRAARRASGAI